MKKLLLPAGFFFIISLAVTTSCDKPEDDGIVIKPPFKVQNLSPVARAGPDKTITLPEDSVILDGSNSTDDGTIIKYEWSNVSGPTVPCIENASSIRAVAKGLKEGEYRFRLSVTDIALLCDQDMITVFVTCH